MGNAVKEGIEIRLNLQDGIPEIEADTGQLTQILVNLSFNSADAMEDGLLSTVSWAKVQRLIIYLPAIHKGLSNVSALDEEKKIKISRGNETILLLENKEELRAQYTTALNRLNYNVLSAKNSEEALDIYLATPKKIDLIISDIMPGKSGMEFFNDLRSINPDVKFILVTDHGLNEQVEYISKEVKAVIKKPYNIQEMALVIREVLDSPA